MKETKKYYFVEYKGKKGQTLYKNQDGKRVSKANVKKGKRKVYILIQNTIPYTNLQKGDLLDRQKKKAKKQSKPIKAETLEILSVLIQKEISQAINENFEIYSKVQGVTYKHESEESKVNLLLFNYDLQGQFYKTFNELVDSPFFFLSVELALRNKIELFDWDSIELNPEIEVSDEIQEALETFKELIEALKNKYF
jgi:hypothetical protein